MKFIRHKKLTIEKSTPQEKSTTKIKCDIPWYFAWQLLQTLYHYPTLRNDEAFITKLKDLENYIETKIPLPDETREIIDEYIVVEIY